MINLFTTAKCYKEIPVTFKYDNEERHGFINSDQIIKLKTQEIDCTTNSDTILFPDHETAANWIQRVGHKNIGRRKKEFNWIPLNLIKRDIGKINIHHAKPIMVGENEIEQIYKIAVNKEESFFIIPVPNDLSIGTAERYIKNIEDTLAYPFELIKKYLYLTILIIILSIIGLLICWYLIKVRCFGVAKAIKRKIPN